jgi:hypothetical protein
LRAACFPLAVLLTSPWAGAQTGTDGTQPAAPAADSRTREQMFRDVFGRAPPQIPINAYLLVTIDAAPQQKLRAILSADERALRVEADALIGLLAHSMQLEVVEALKRATDNEGWITRPALEATGIGTTFDSRTFTLSLSTDPRLRARRVEYLSGTAPSLANALRPAALSAFVNLNAKAAHRDESAWRVRAMPNPAMAGGSSGAIPGSSTTGRMKRCGSAPGTCATPSSATRQSSTWAGWAYHATFPFNPTCATTSPANSSSTWNVRPRFASGSTTHW